MKKSKLILLICMIIAFLLGVQVLFHIPAPCKWLEYVPEAGGFISFVGTVSLGLVTVYQTSKANEISHRLLKIEEEKRRPQIDIRAIAKDRLAYYNHQQLLTASVEGVFGYVDSNWEIKGSDGDDFWFEIKNTKDTDILEIKPIMVTSNILDSDGKLVSSNKYGLSTSYSLNLIQGNETIPFLLRMDDVWVQVAQNWNQSLLLSLEFVILNADGEKYLQQICLSMVNAYSDFILTPFIFKKEIGKSKLID